MSEAKPRLVWVAEHDDDSDYLSVMERLDTQGVYEGVTVCRLHDEAAADLIADAGTVFNTTGLTPSQLVERVKELEEDMRLIAGTDPIEAMLDPQRAIRVANAALSKARPNTAEGEAPSEADREELEAVIACLGDDAATLREQNPECEMAANMDRAAELLAAAKEPSP